MAAQDVYIVTGWYDEDEDGYKSGVNSRAPDIDNICVRLSLEEAIVAQTGLANSGLYLKVEIKKHSISSHGSSGVCVDSWYE